MTGPVGLLRRIGSLPVGEKAMRRDIQGLRGIAVILVLLAHAGVPGFAGGFLAVDMFFVLSGFLITGLLVREVRDSGKVSLVGFYARRARRILPAATVVLVVTVLVSAAVLPFVEADRVGRDAVWAALFAANVHYALEGTDYFAGDLTASAFQHFWSLAVEEQFYILWPVVVLALAWFAARRSRIATPGAVAIAALAAVVASFAWSLFVSETSPNTAYFSTFARAWQLGVGALLACVALPISRWLSPIRRELLAAGGTALIVITLFSVDPRTPWPGAWALFPVIGTAAFIAAGLPYPRAADGSRIPLPGPTLTSRLVEIAPVRWVGDISYSLYLWHWPPLVLLPIWLGRDLTVLEASALSVLVVPVAAISYYLVENPFRHGAETLDSAGQRRALTLWPVAVALSLAAVLASGWYVAEQQTSTRNEIAALTVPPTPRSAARSVDAGAGVSAALAVMTTDEAADSLIPFPLEQDLLELFDDKVQFEERCTAEPDESSHDICPAGDLESPETVVLFGDSHMNMWSPGFDRVAQRVGVRVVPLIKFGCTPVDLTILRVDVNRPYDECAAWREWALQQIDNLSPAAVVVASHTQFQALDDTGAVLKGAVRNRVWRAGVRSTARSLAPLADQVRFLGDLTYLDTSPADCLSRRGATIGDCTVSTSRTVRVMDALMRQGVRGTGARVVPLTAVLCSAGQCPLVAAGRSVYRDVTHVSASWAEYAGAALWDDLALELAAERSP